MSIPKTPLILCFVYGRKPYGYGLFKGGIGAPLSNLFSQATQRHHFHMPVSIQSQSRESHQYHTRGNISVGISINGRQNGGEHERAGSMFRIHHLLPQLRPHLNPKALQRST